MADVFISYRHGSSNDSWAAAAIQGKLKAAGIDVFFDGDYDKLDLGERFPKKIEDALAECTVVFPIIGTDWTHEKNLVRLVDPEDWVRRELVAALGSKAHVVPLMIGGTRVPAADKLPDVLKPLCDLNGMPVEASQLQPQSNQLVQRLSEWLKLPPAGAAATTVAVPPALPYLCDRIDQEAFFVDSYASETSPRMIACVIHGHRNESHTALLDRFLAAGLIDKVLRCQEEGARSVLLRPAPFKLKNAQFGDALKSAFKSAVMDKITAADAELRAYLSALPNPLVCEVQVTWSAFKEVGDQTIKGLIDAWMALPSVGGETSVRLPFSALLWVNLTYDDLETELAEPVLVKPLPKLPDLGEQEVLDWLRLTDVRKHASRKHNDLLKIVSMPEYCHQPGRVHMMQFAEAFQKIISAP